MLDLLEAERDVLARLIYRSKNQHRTSVLFRKMEHLHRLLKRDPYDPQKAVECCQRLYIAGTSYLKMGHFIPLSVCVTALAARIALLITKIHRLSHKKKNPIDEIFG
ncbi:hypothetical protein PAPHI01_2819 [Pancytospora philotis]|nr:hypothetical protein PAPHI01_2819 [Pancytospora philotis]